MAVLLAIAAAGILGESSGRTAGRNVALGSRMQRQDMAGWQFSQDHYSTLSQINRTNVHKLTVAWKFDTGEGGNGNGLETNPLVIDRVMYAFTPLQKVIAVDGANGRLLWKFDSGIKGHQPTRGLSYWTDGKDKRLLCGVMHFLYELDALTGKPIPTFGEDGRIDLRKGLGGDYLRQSIALTSPGVIYKNLVIVGGREPETPPAPPGDIRAFDVRTGKLVWRFHTIPHPGEPGYNTWPPNAWKTAGAANNWAGMTLDAKHGIVYVPTGSAVPDFYGGARAGDDLFADTLLALDAATGRMIWYFQGVHHDLWDRDFPAPPVLLTVKHNGKLIDAIAQTTKQGFVFLLNRDTGKPIFPVEERPVVQSNVPGEVTAKTQPFPLLPTPYTRQSVTINDLTNRTPAAHAAAVKQFQTFISGDEQFYPLTIGKETITAPGYDGGGEWGGPAVDRATGVIYINSNNVANTGGLAVNDPNAGLGLRTYQTQCALCHRDNRGGSPPNFPSLIGVGQRLTQAQIIETIHGGKGRMPSFPNIQDGQLTALLKYVRTGIDASAVDMEKKKEAKAVGSMEMQHQGPGNPLTEQISPAIAEMNRYHFTGYHEFNDPDGYPGVTPPWGTLSAIDMNTGKYLWKIPLGEYPELAAKGMANTGTENYGGPIVTAGGLVIIGATAFDKKIRAFDRRTGTLLWQYQLPFAAAATPTTYMLDGKQYIVIASGGSRLTHGADDGFYVAFALP